MQGRYNDKLQTVTAKEELTVSGGGAGEAGINKDEAAWWGGGNPLSQALLGMNSGSGPL